MLRHHSDEGVLKDAFRALVRLGSHDMYLEGHIVALSRLASDRDVVVSSALELACASVDPTTCLLITKLGGVPQLLAALARSPGDSDIAAHVTHAFEHITEERSDTFITAIVAASGLSLMLAAFADHASDGDVVSNVAGFLLSMSDASRDNSLIVVSAGGVPLLVAALVLNADVEVSTGIQIVSRVASVLEILTRNAAAPDAVLQAIVAAGGISLILSALGRNSVEAHTVLDLQLVLLSLAAASPINCDAAASNGGIPLLLAALSTFNGTGNHLVVRTSAITLCHLLHASPSRRSAFFAAGGCSLFLAALATDDAVDELSANIWSATLFTAVRYQPEGAHAACSSAGCIPMLLTALSRHSTHVEVTANLSGVMNNYLSRHFDVEDFGTIVAAGGVAILLSASPSPHHVKEQLIASRAELLVSAIAELSGQLHRYRDGGGHPRASSNCYGRRWRGNSRDPHVAGDDAGQCGE